MSLTFGSVCSGIEAASLAWAPLGWRAAFFSEVAAFPRAVLRHHHPEVPLHGDFTTIGPGDYDPIDLLVGGTPCQSFSVAGLRGGLGDERGNLALEYLRLADRLRPRWLVWENVPGVFSATSHLAPDPCPPDIDLDGDDGPRDGEEVVVEDEYDADESHAFACVLAGFSELGYGFAYRVFDAQYFGVAQRRRRVFVVGHLGDWRRAAAVLFERASLSGHPAPRREAGKSAAGTLAGGARERGGYSADDIPAVAQTLTAGGNSPNPLDEPLVGVSPFTEIQAGDWRESVGTLLTAHEAKSPSTLLAHDGVAHALRGEGFDASEDGTGRGTPIVAVHAFDARQSDVIQYGDKTGPLDTDGHTMAICFSSKDHGADAETELAPTLRAGGHLGSHANAGCPPAVAFALRGREEGAVPEVNDSGETIGALRAASGGSSRDYVAFAENSRAELRLEGGDGQTVAALKTGGGQTRSELSGHRGLHMLGSSERVRVGARFRPDPGRPKGRRRFPERQLQRAEGRAHPRLRGDRGRPAADPARVRAAAGLRRRLHPDPLWPRHGLGRPALQGAGKLHGRAGDGLDRTADRHGRGTFGRLSMTIYRVRWGRLRPMSGSCVRVFYPSEADACFAEACFPVADPPDWAVVESHGPGALEWIPVRTWSLSTNHNGARQS